MPYRKTYSLKSGQSWFDAETTNLQWEHYVQNDAGAPIPIGGKIAQELKLSGAAFAGFTEMWGGFVVVDHRLTCVDTPDVMRQIISDIRASNRDSLSGFPDVFAIYPDGRIALREAKVARLDRIQPQQHRMADLLRSKLGMKADLAVIEWNS